MASGNREDKLGCTCCALLPLENMSEHHRMLMQLHEATYQLRHNLMVVVLLNNGC